MVLRRDANLRTGPKIESRKIQALLKDTLVIKKEAAHGWYRVYCPTIKKTGWINSGLLRPVESAKKITPTIKKEPEPTPYNKKITVAAPQKSPEAIQAGPRHVISPYHHKLPPLAIAIIDLQQVIEKSKKGRSARLKFEDIKRENSGLDPAQAEQELLAPIIMEIRLLVEIYARENNLTHVLNKNSGALFHYDERFDITGDIIRLYDRQNKKP